MKTVMVALLALSGSSAFAREGGNFLIENHWDRKVASAEQVKASEVSNETPAQPTATGSSDENCDKPKCC